MMDPNTSAHAVTVDTLLVVDSHVENVRALESMLGLLGFKIIPAANKKEALEILGSREPDLILINFPWEAESGFALCKRIQNDPLWAAIPVIFYADSPDRNLAVQALESGGADYLTLPFIKAELLSRLRTHLMMRTATNHMKQLARDKDELLGIISHYLQSNLGSVLMGAQVLADKTAAGGDPKLRLMAENVLASVTQMRAFVKSTLANAAADQGFQLHPERLDFSAAVNARLACHGKIAGAKNITLLCEAPQEGAFIEADPSALEQVLDNLVSNAIKFSPPRKKITVTVKNSGGFVECRIADEGPGLTEEDQTRMFNRYARLSARPTGGEPSTGLGLSIAKKLVHAQHGELTCASAPGQGATFVVRFPLAAPGPKDAGPVSAPAVAQHRVQAAGS